MTSLRRIARSLLLRGHHPAPHDDSLVAGPPLISTSSLTWHILTGRSSAFVRHCSDDPDQIAQELYDLWTHATGDLWSTVHGDAARARVIEHLARHPDLLVTDPVWRRRLIEVTVAHATQVLLPASYLPPLPHEVCWRGDDVRAMLRGLHTIPGAQVPVAITPAFVAADQLLQRFYNACTYEETPLGFMNPGRGMDEFPETDDSVQLEKRLREHLAAHPELAGTHQFASWYGDDPAGPLRNGS